MRNEMRKTAAIVALVVSLAALSSCSIGTKGDNPAYELRLNFQKGAGATGNIIYVAWLADSGKDFVRYFYTCERLDYAAFKGSSDYSNIKSRATCPYWRKNLYETALDDGVDVMSGATMRDQDFMASATVPAGSPSRFTVYFEYDRSRDPNYWWTDQPSILYAADVNLDEVASSKTYGLTARGWSRNAGPSSYGADDGGNANKGDLDFPNATGVGELVTEMRYITNREGTGGALFGAAYGNATNTNGSACDATTMVGSLNVTITRK
jgi:hypothetical protein